MSDNSELVNFAVKLADSVEQLKFPGKMFQEIKITKLVTDVTFLGLVRIQGCTSMHVHS